MALLMVALLSFGQLMAQPNSENREEIKAKRLKKELMLDNATGEKFETLYQEYSKALKECFPMPEHPKAPAAAEGGKEKARAERPAPRERTDEEIKQHIQKSFEVRQKVLDVQKEYYGKFEKILNASQLEKLFAPTPRFAPQDRFGRAPRKEKKQKGDHRREAKQRQQQPTVPKA